MVLSPKQSEIVTRAVAWLRSLGGGDLASAGLGFGLTFVLGTLALTAFGRPAPPAAEQPVAFNHRIHVEDLGLECSDCHPYVETETFSGVPDAETCMLCHEEAQGEGPEEQKLLALLSEGRPLEWQPLFRQPSHVFYSHRRHAAVADLECETCHGAIGTSERPPGRVHLLTMDECIDCHQREGVAEDCTSCHR